MTRRLLLAALTGCTAAEPTPPGDVWFEVDGTFWQQPLPSSTRRADDGSIPLGDFPNPNAAELVDRLTVAATAVGDFSGTGPITFPLRVTAPDVTWPALVDTIDHPGVALVNIDRASDAFGRRVPVDIGLAATVQYGPASGISLLPLQGMPLEGATTWAAVLTGALVPTLTAPRALVQLQRGESPEGWRSEDVDRWQEALDTLTELGLDDPRALTVFRTADPMPELRQVAEVTRWRWVEDPSFTEAFDGYCVFTGLAEVSVFQAGTPPYDTEGGWVIGPDGPEAQRTESARVVLTVPRTEASPREAVVFVRTGGGGDRPLVDRGIRDTAGAAVSGTGYAEIFAAEGYAGVMVDGPLGGLRNPNGADEQFLIFNVTNPEAMRDNLRQSAVELAALPELLADRVFDTSACEGTDATLSLHTDRLVLFGHSMGATIAPVAAALQPAYDTLILSGAGGSWIHNLLSKQLPIPVRPIAASILGESETALDRFHPALGLLQWAGEAADPPVYGHMLRDRHVLMLQGIVDHYILPDIANSLSLSMGLDLAGPGLDAEAVPDMPGIRTHLGLVGGEWLDLPASANQGGRTRVVVQHAEDGVEDGHEVAFQLPAARTQVGCFLRSLAAGEPVVSATGCE